MIYICVLDRELVAIIPYRGLIRSLPSNSCIERIVITRLFTNQFLCKAPELLDAVLHKIHAASARGMYPARTLAGVA